MGRQVENLACFPRCGIYSQTYPPILILNTYLGEFQIIYQVFVGCLNIFIDLQRFRLTPNNCFAGLKRPNLSPISQKKWYLVRILPGGVISSTQNLKKKKKKNSILPIYIWNFFSLFFKGEKIYN